MGPEHTGGIDLHIHTTASDGTCTPAEIVRMALDLPLRAIAITDHDTLSGARAVAAGGVPENLKFLTGVEISAAAPPGFKMGGSLHILGYGVHLENAPLEQALADLQQARDARIPKIVGRLNRIGIDITMPDVLSLVGQGSAGRPHVAQALIRSGVVRDVNEAFDRYLAKGQPAYVEKRRIDCHHAIALIRSAGGIPVLAHPYLVPGGQSEALCDLLKPLRDMGLMGIEAYYSQHPPASVALYLELARRYHLLVTGGSDFHGSLIPEIGLGRGHGDLYVPFELYEILAAGIERQKAD